MHVPLIVWYVFKRGNFEVHVMNKDSLNKSAGSYTHCNIIKKQCICYSVTFECVTSWKNWLQFNVTFNGYIIYSLSVDLFIFSHPASQFWNYLLHHYAYNSLTIN